MNVNLDHAVSREGAQPRLTDVDTIGAMIRDSADELARHDDTRPIGSPLLVPEGVEYPGSYRVCFPVATEGNITYYIYIDADGVAHRFVAVMEGYDYDV